MWTEHEQYAVKIGLDYETYWTEPPRYFNKRLEAWEKREEQRAQEADVNNYNLGIYMSYAFNNPKKYPKRPFLSKDNSKKVDWRRHKAFMRKLSKNNIKNKNNGSNN